MATRLAVRGLSKRHGSVEAVSDVGFEIGAGEVLGLLGPNGAGKTTTVESIIGLVEPDAGAIEICGIDARARPRAARAKIGVVLQSTGLQDKITPREALALFGRLHGTAGGGKALLDRFGLMEKADAAFDTLSGGQRQRLALALAFVGEPEVVFLDEPTAGLDPHIRRDVHAHVRAMRAAGCAVLLTTHDMAEAEQLCDRVVMLDRGRIVAEGRPDALLGGAQGMVEVRLQASGVPEGGWPAGLPFAGALATEEGGVRFATADLNRAMAEMIAFLDARGIAITGVRAGQPTLEDVLLRLTGGRA